jgi:26S proteasome regulatory subunit N3
MQVQSLAVNSILLSVKWLLIQPMVCPVLFKSKEAKDVSSEVDCFIGYLVLVHCFNAKTPYTTLALSLLAHIRAANQRYSSYSPNAFRSLDSLQAKILFYHYLTAPRDRAILLAQHKTASLRNDRDTQAVLLNTLLRSLIDANEYQLADKLVNKTTFPASAGSNQWARYLYYCGRIQAIQLDYTASYAHLTNALRKALTTRATAGFQQAVYKVAVIVQLLMGEIPERGIFRQPMLKKALAPYLEITSGLFLFL